MLNSSDNGYNSLEAHVLEAYYLGHNSWDGVGARLTQSASGGPLQPNDVLWSEVTLLDKAGRIVVDAGRADRDRIGQPYHSDQAANDVPLVVNGAQVGQLILRGGADRSCWLCYPTCWCQYWRFHFLPPF